MTSAEYTEWVAFYKSFPWDYGSALVVATITNMMRKDGVDAKSAHDFMPADYVPPDPVEGMWTYLRQVAAAGAKHGKH